MTDATANIAKAPFGVGGVLGDTFSVFFSRLPTFFLLGFLPALITLAINYMLIGDVALGQEDPVALQRLFSTPAGIATFVAGSFIVPAIGYGLSTAMIVRGAYDVKLGRPPKLGAYVGAAIVYILPIVVLTIAVTLMASIAMLALIVPGLYVYAMFSVVIPVIVIENAGFGALGRSAELTKGYRWPLLGGFLVMLLVMIALSMAVTLTLVPGLLDTGGVTAAVIVSAVLNAVIGALMAVFYSMAYARLRELKEGLGVDQLAAVFE